MRKREREREREREASNLSIFLRRQQRVRWEGRRARPRWRRFDEAEPINRCWPASGWSKTPQLDVREGSPWCFSSRPSWSKRCPGGRQRTERARQPHKHYSNSIKQQQRERYSGRGCAKLMERTMKVGCSFVCGHCCLPGRKHELRTQPLSLLFFSFYAVPFTPPRPPH